MPGEIRGVEKRSDNKIQETRKYPDFVKNQRFFRYVYNIFVYILKLKNKYFILLILTN